MVVPANIFPGTVVRGSVVHASEGGSATDSRGHLEEEISRLQSALNNYNTGLTYDVGDLVLESGSGYRCITAVTIPEAFDPAKWQLYGEQTPWISDIDADEFNLLQAGYIDFLEIAIEPGAPPTDTVRLFADPDTEIAGDEPRLIYKDETGEIRDISSAGYQVQNFDSDDAKSNEYFALNGPKDGKNLFTDREIIVPRSTRWYNLYVIIAFNSVNTDVDFSVYDDVGITALTLVIPANTTGVFSNVTTVLDTEIATSLAYRLGAFGGGNITLNAAGMAMDILRIIP